MARSRGRGGLSALTAALAGLLSQPGPIASAATVYPWACKTNSSYPFCNASLPLPSRLDDLLSRLDQADLVNNMYAAPWPTGGSSSLAIPPAIFWSEATHGATNDASFPTTFFPMPSLTSCAFNLSLAAEIAGTIGREGRAASNMGYNAFVFWAPHTNLVRDPRGGRSQEVPGEDPTFSALWAATTVRAMQESPLDPRYRQVVSTAKHLAVYSFEGFYDSPINRMNFDAIVTPQDLADTYLVPFSGAFLDGHAGGAMCSYTAINGIPSCADSWLLQDILRSSWGFTGYVTGDCGAVQNVGPCPPTGRCHNFTATNSTTAAAVLSAGTTMDCGSAFTAWLPDAVADGHVTTQMLQSAARANLAARFSAGAFDPPSGQPLAALGNESVCTPAAAALSLRAAEEGMVLLKNVGAADGGGGLPLARDAVKSLALVGGNANDTMMQLCSYYSTPCGGFGAMVSPLAALMSDGGFAVTYELGCDAGCGNTSGFAPAAAAAAAADATVLAVGLNCKLTGEGVDRGTITLPGSQDLLISQVCAAARTRGAPCVVLVFSGSSLDLSAPLANPNVTAIVFVGYGGPHGGTAVLRLLFGDAAPPAGRLTATWFTAGYVDEVSMMDMGMRPSNSSPFPPGANPGHTHRFYTGNHTLFEFGYGLSYTTWRYGAPAGPAVVSLDASRAYVAAARAAATAAARRKAGDPTPITLRDTHLAAVATSLRLSVADAPVAAEYSVNVTNTGAVDSDDVVLGFLVPPGAGTNGVPLQELFGFERVHVPAGQTVTVWLGVSALHLTGVGEDAVRVPRPGVYTVRAGVRSGEAHGLGLSSSTFVAE
jgi:xylan 1,4-beta-xylosidase